MTAFSRLGLWCLCAGVVAVGCSPPPPPPPPTIDVTIAPASIVADGVSTATVTLSYTADVRLQVGQGKFRESNSAAYTIVGGSGSATLISCDSRVASPCGGSVRVSATSASDGASGSGTLTFTSLENCSNKVDDNGDGLVDCGDPTCTGIQCGLPAGSVGVGLCDSAGACNCYIDGGVSEAAESRCDDGRDNDCDGKTDCGDSTCVGKACQLSAGIKGACTATTCACPGVAENTDATCKDGIDNDCDGVADCADPDCQPVGNNRGKICDNLGNACSIPTNGVSTCTICAGNGGLPEPGGEVSCGDDKDNDCDGIIDCIDSDCAGLRCKVGGLAFGRTCNAGRTCTCPGGSPESVCDDNFDNDCNGQVDCADVNCKPGGAVAGGSVCGPFGKTCTAASACACSGNGGTAQATETSCNDGFDNDCDGQIDCLDADCRATAPTFTNGKLCGAAGSGRKCDAVGVCICPGGQATESLCSDTLDNDCDGLPDCNDSNCFGKSCNANGGVCPATASATCSVCSGNGGPVELNETTCSDFHDNDCDGLVDCFDPDCANQGCSTLSANYKCTGTPVQCRDTTSTVNLTLVANPTKIAANGTSTSAITATLKDGATALGSKTIVFSVSSGTGSVSPDAGITNGSGITSTNFTSGAAGGNAVVQGAYDTGTQLIYGAVAISQPRLGAIVLVSQTQSIMGVDTSGFNETNTIVFQVNDEVGQPYPSGLAVVMTHTPVAGSYIGAPGNCTTTLCTANTTTDSAGRVSIVLHSGRVAGVVAVTASATAGGISGSASASNIAIVGAKASGLQVSINCSPRNLPTYSSHDCLKSLYSGPSNQAICTAAFADRFLNVLGRSTLTTFTTESGAATAPSLTNALGSSTGTILMTGYSLPLDVDAGVNEPSVLVDDGCGPKVHNPRDGLATIIVSANGEEGFIDGSNGQPSDGIYNVGENFLDIGEPFVDSNDNNIRDNNEPYVDSNNNGSWDGPNGVWDADTTVWASTRVLYSGRAAVATNLASQNLVTRWYDLLSSPQPPLPTAQPTFVVGVSPNTDGGTTPNTTTLGLWFSDWNLNQPSPLAAYTLSVTPTTAATATFLTNPTTTVNDLGMNFTQQYCDTQLGTGTCGSACNATPCYLVTKIDGFSAGRSGVVEIRGGTTATSPITVQASSSLNTLPTGVSVTGYSQ